MLTNVALSGTEDGSFCPDCPDWTNLDGWYKQRQAYSQSLLNPMSSGSNASQLQLKSADMDYETKEIINEPEDVRGVIIDSRSPEEYRSGHIPGARNIYWRSVRSGDALDPALLLDALRSNGINTTDDVIIYGDGSEASYLFWAMKYIGHKNVSMLNGGINAWKAAGHRLVQNSPVMERSDYRENVSEDVLVTAQNLEKIMKDNSVQLIDTRKSFAEFGISRLNGAIWMPASMVFEDGYVKDAGSLESVFSGRGIDKNKTQIVYGAMPEASIMYYCLRLMGYRAMLLDGDWRKSDLVVGNIR